jgi:hypothetical protein
VEYPNIGWRQFLQKVVSTLLFLKTAKADSRCVHSIVADKERPMTPENGQTAQECWNRGTYQGIANRSFGAFAKGVNS